MGQPVKFEGANHHYGPPPGREEEVGTLHVFSQAKAGRGINVVCCWELSDEELEEINRTRRVWVSTMTGTMMVPIFVGSASTVRSVIVDFGPIWKGEE